MRNSIFTAPLFILVILSTSCDQLFPTKTDTIVVRDTLIRVKNDFPNRSLHFGSNWGYFELPSRTLLKLRSFTIEFWINFDSLSSPTTPVIQESYLDQRTQADGYSVKYEEGRWYLRLALASNLAGGVSYTYQQPLHQWTHIAVTFGNQVVMIYINGVQVASGSFSDSLYYGNHGLWFGLGYHSTFGGYNGFFGYLDEMRIWNVVRSQQEIQTAMNSSLQYLPTSVIAYWKFDQDTSSTVVEDFSGKANHGFIWGDVSFSTIVPFP